MNRLRRFTARRRRVWITGLVIMVLSIMLGCTPSVIFYGDPILRAIVADPGEFRRFLEQAAEDEGRSLALEWDPSVELGTAWLEDRIVHASPAVAVLSPYFSLFASDLAETYADVYFIGFAGGAPEQANLTRVVFDRVPAMEDAGSLVKTWEEAGTDRKAAALFLTNSEMGRAELEALVDSYEGEGVETIRISRFDISPDRETVRRAIRDLRADGVNAFLVFIGPSNRFALELLQSEPVVFATDFASAATSLGDALLFSIENRLDIALASALDAVGAGAEGGIVTVHSRVEIGRAYADPQLSAPPSDESPAVSGDES
ncbi:MAG: hypothetical protein V3S41_00775 [Spirochaetia bacterium]